MVPISTCEKPSAKRPGDGDLALVEPGGEADRPVEVEAEAADARARAGPPGGRCAPSAASRARARRARGGGRARGRDGRARSGGRARAWTRRLYSTGRQPRPAGGRLLEVEDHDDRVLSLLRVVVRADADLPVPERRGRARARATFERRTSSVETNGARAGGRASCASSMSARPTPRRRASSGGRDVQDVHLVVDEPEHDVARHPLRALAVLARRGARATRRGRARARGARATTGARTRSARSRPRGRGPPRACGGTRGVGSGRSASVGRRTAAALRVERIEDADVGAARAARREAPSPAGRRAPPRAAPAPRRAPGRATGETPLARR